MRSRANPGKNLTPSKRWRYMSLSRVCRRPKHFGKNLSHGAIAAVRAFWDLLHGHLYSLSALQFGSHSSLVSWFMHRPPINRNIYEFYYRRWFNDYVSRVQLSYPFYIHSYIIVGWLVSTWIRRSDRILTIWAVLSVIYSVVLGGAPYFFDATKYVPYTSQN